MQTCKKFKQFVEGSFDVINELASFMMENVALVWIKVSFVRTCATDEFVGANEQVQSDVVIVEEHRQANVHIMKEEKQEW